MKKSIKLTLLEKSSQSITNSMKNSTRNLLLQLNNGIYENRMESKYLFDHK